MQLQYPLTGADVTFHITDLHGISRRSSLPQWSPTPPAAPHRPAPASMSLPVPSYWALPSIIDERESLLVDKPPHLYHVLNCEHGFSKVIHPLDHSFNH